MPKILYIMGCAASKNMSILDVYLRHNLINMGNIILKNQIASEK